MVRDTSIENYFSLSYQQARNSFVSAAETCGLEIEPYKNPLTGINGEELYTDVVWIGEPTARNVLVTSSGTHGPEGILGSAVQVASLLEGYYSDLPESTAVLLIHAINPWGFSWMRRVNEDGVDLFRNFIDFAHPKPANGLYDILVNQVIVPKKIDFLAQIATNVKMAYYLLKYGKGQVKTSIARGQYKYPHAPFYGGEKPAWSNFVLRRIINSYLSHSENVAVIDYHTGLGPFAESELIGFDKQGDHSYQRAKECWGSNYVSVFSGDTTAYEISGILANAYKEELPSTKLIFGAHEFGTMDEFKVFRALQADHWLHAYGDLNSEAAKQIQTKTREAFYCDNDVWRRKVLERAFAAEHHVFNYFSSM